jgi:hypothetical protein
MPRGLRVLPATSVLHRPPAAAVRDRAAEEAPRRARHYPASSFRRRESNAPRGRARAPPRPAPPVIPPRRTPRLPWPAGAGAAPNQSGQRLGYSQSVSHPSRGRGGMERPLRRCRRLGDALFPAVVLVVVAPTSLQRLRCFCGRGIRARARASAPLRGFRVVVACSYTAIVGYGAKDTLQPRVPGVFVYSIFGTKGLNILAIACTHCMARGFAKGIDSFLAGRRSSFRNPLPKGRQ